MKPLHEVNRFLCLLIMWMIVSSEVTNEAAISRFSDVYDYESARICFKKPAWCQRQNANGATADHSICLKSITSFINRPTEQVDKVFGPWRGDSPCNAY
jgi:hypothetical protein